MRTDYDEDQRLYIQRLTNNLKAEGGFGTQVTERETHFFDNLAAALLHKVIRETTAHNRETIGLIPSGSLARGPPYNIPSLVSYYQRLGFRRTRPQPYSEDGESGLALHATTIAFLKNTERQIGERWIELDRPTKVQKNKQ